MFIDHQELDKLVAYKNENNPVVSVYLKGSRSFHLP